MTKEMGIKVIATGITATAGMVTTVTTKTTAGITLTIETTGTEEMALAKTTSAMMTRPQRSTQD